MKLFRKASQRMNQVFYVLILLSLAFMALALTTDSDDGSVFEKEIEIIAGYADDSEWDDNNDGIVEQGGVIDFTVEDTVFNWEVDEENVCTLWEISEDSSDEVKGVCFGSERCCNFLELGQSREDWDETFFLPAGKFGAGNYNTISSQVIYVDYSLEIGHAFQDIVFSEKVNIPADFNIVEDANVSIEDKDGEDIGEYELVIREDEKFDLTITVGEEEEAIVGVSTEDVVEESIEIKGLEEIPDNFTAIIDTVDDEDLTTSVVFVDDVTIEQATITLAKQGNVNVILHCADFDKETFSCNEWEKTDIAFVDNGDSITFTVDHFSGYGGGEIGIINVQSYPMVGGNWTVRFTTNGTENLIITPVNGTAFGVDLTFLELRCGSTLLNPVVNSTSVFYGSWNCAQEGTVTNKVLTTGKHHLLFSYGQDEGYAHNEASNVEQTANPLIVNASGVVSLSATWNDNAEQQYLTMCKDSICTDCWFNPAGGNETSGCYCVNLTLQASPQSCLYTTSDLDSTTNNFFAQLYNASVVTYNGGVINTGATPTASFEVNHRPTAANINVNASSLVTNETLTCNYTISDSDSDSEGSGTNFKWYVNDTLESTETSSTLDSSFFNKTQTLICSVNISDEHGFFDDEFVNSSSVTIQNLAPTQPSVNLSPDSPNLDDDLNCSVTTASTDADPKDSVTYFYLWSNGSVFVTNGPTSNISNTLSSSDTLDGQTWTCTVIPTDGTDNGTSSSDVGDKVTDLEPQFSNQNASNQTPNHGEVIYLSANWTDDDGLDVARLQTNATGGFGDTDSIQMSGTSFLSNFTFNTTGFIGTIGWRIVANDTAGQTNINMPVASFNITDVTPPQVDISSIGNFSNDTLFTWFFNLTDDFFVNASTLIINVTNSTNTTYHVLAGSPLFGINNFDFGANISCNTLNQTIVPCNLTLNKSDSSYNATFVVNDTSGNTNTTLLVNFIVDTTEPAIGTVANGYSLTGTATISAISNTNTLFANWTNVTDDESGMDHFEVAIGAGATYLATNWDSVQNFTSVGLNNSITITIPDLDTGFAYYFHVRGQNKAGSFTNVSSSSGVLYIDDTPPVCPGFNSVTGDGCITDGGDWDNSESSLQASWNFTDNGSDVIKYEYAIGTKRYPQTGFEDTKARTNTTVTSILATSLSLAHNTTYTWNVRAMNENNLFSDFYYSNNITVDLEKPFNGSISYTNINITTNQTTISLQSGVDTLSDILSVQLQQSQVAIDPAANSCEGFSAFAQINGTITKDTQTVVVTVPAGFCYRFRYLVTDRAGNTETYYFSSQLFHFKVDQTAPESFEAQLNNGDFFTSSTPLTLNWSVANDPESGIKYYTYKLNDSTGTELIPFTNTTANLVTLSNLNLEHTVSYTATVVAFNDVDLFTTAVSNSILFLDQAPPDSVTVVQVANDTNSSDGYLDAIDDGITNVSAVAGENSTTCVYTEFDIDYTELSVYSSFCTDTGGPNLTCNISVSEGNHTRYISCKDSPAGNEQDSSQNTKVNWIVDFNPPNITIVSPAENSTVGGIVSIDVDIIDAGVGQISFSSYNITNLTGDVVDSGTLSSPDYNTTWDSTAFATGIHTISVFANDTLGRATSKSQNFSITDDEPLISISNPTYTNTDFNLSMTLQFFVNASVNITNASGALKFNDTNTSTSFRNFLVWTEFINVTNVTEGVEGNYTISVFAIDNQSNSTTATSFFIYDVTAPSFSAAFNTSPAFCCNASTVTLSINVTDAFGVDSVNVSHNANGSFVNVTATASGSTYSISFSDNLENNETIIWRSYAFDNAGNFNTSSDFNFTVTNRFPTVSVAEFTFSFNEDSTGTINLSGGQSSFSDPDGDNLTLNSSGSANIGIVSINQTTFIVVVNATANFTGLEQVIFNASDPYGGWNITIGNITVTNVNDAPFLNNSLPDMSLGRTDSNSTIDLDEFFADIDSNLSYTATRNNTNVSVAINGSGVMNVSTSGADATTVNVTINASDSEFSVIDSFVVTITNNVPTVAFVFVNSTFGNNATSENLTCWVNATDADSDDLEANFTWYNNSIAVINGSSNISSLNLISFVNVSTILSTTTAKTQNWSCGVLVFDGLNLSGLVNSTNLTILNTQPQFDHSLDDQTILVGSEFVYDINASDADGETLTYLDNATQFVINESNGTLSYTPSVIETFDVNITVCDSSGDANNCTSGIFTISSTINSIFFNSYVNGTFYADNTSFSVTGVSISTVNNSNVSGPVISVTNSTILNSTVINSTIDDSTIDNATLETSNITNSTVVNSSIFESSCINANISGGIIYTGNCTSQGSTYDASANGAENLTDILNYRPSAFINATPISGTVPLTVTFNGTLSTDPNIPGDLNDTLSFAWDFTTDGTDDNTSNFTSYTYSSSGTFTATLIVKDKFNVSDAATQTISVSAVEGAAAAGGGGGGGATGLIIIPFTEEGKETSLAVQSSGQITFDGSNYVIRVNAITDEVVMITIGGVQQQLSVGESVKMNLNGDQYDDLFLEIRTIEKSRARFFIQQVHEVVSAVVELPSPIAEEIAEKIPVPEQPSPPVPEVAVSAPLPFEEAATSVWAYGAYALTALIVVGLVTTSLLIKRKALHKKKKIHRHVRYSFEEGNHIYDLHKSLLDKGLTHVEAQHAELDYIIGQLVKRWTLEDIQKVLLARGWEEDIVGHAVLNHYINHALDKRKPKEAIRGSLLSQGWDSARIETVMRKFK